MFIQQRRGGDTTGTLTYIYTCLWCQTGKTWLSVQTNVRQVLLRQTKLCSSEICCHTSVWAIKRFKEWWTCLFMKWRTVHVILAPVVTNQVTGTLYVGSKQVNLYEQYLVRECRKWLVDCNMLIVFQHMSMPNEQFKAIKNKLLPKDIHLKRFNLDVIT